MPTGYLDYYFLVQAAHQRRVMMTIRASACHYSEGPFFPSTASHDVDCMSATAMSLALVAYTKSDDNVSRIALPQLEGAAIYTSTETLGVDCSR